MSFSLNRVELVGNLVRDPEMKQFGNGGKVVNMTVATSESWKDKQSGEKKERSEYHRVVIFNEHLANIAETYLRKGSKVFVSGALQTRKWEQDGTTKYSTEIVLQKFNGELGMLDRAGDPAGFEPDELSDEIPF